MEMDSSIPTEIWLALSGLLGSTRVLATWLSKRAGDCQAQQRYQRVAFRLTGALSSNS